MKLFVGGDRFCVEAAVCCHVWNLECFQANLWGCSHSLLIVASIFFLSGSVSLGTQHDLLGMCFQF